MFDTNLFGPINLIKEVLPDMRLKKAAAIINISSLGVLTCDSGGGYYAASKAALEKISVALRKEVAPLGIKVMVVESGPFRTNFRVSHVTGQNKNISDYASVKKARDKLALDPFGQKGDPQKAGKAIVAAIEKDDYPKTILLGKGISDKVKKNCDFLVKIPMMGRVTSLNASVSTGIIIYEALKQRLQKKN